ncbi:SDR family NAD(P)-dependent oxidoreductase [Paracoccus versutus]|uniref:SDR family NAD(P)-dependent oxidoreductase n=1 Tax=Paracoccus versutus TaxID=34007 RepID=UPI000DF77BCE|nr:SDR family oxidoreductase [Paracoccus versutus]RDD69827.1 SDR family NAD(P)-dependent oxidoreductase [Paracoccus versutus]
MSRLSNRTIIVTGAARGIGASYARALAAEGARVAICDVLDPGPVVARIEAAGGEAFGALCDITDAASVADLVAQVKARFGRIDGLVNNAAIFAALKPRPFEQIASEEFDRVLQVNVRGGFECIRAVLPGMRAQGYGKIVNIASGTVYKGTPGLLHYTASKGAIIALTRVVAREVGGDGIRVNCVAPGFTLSEGILDAEETAAINRATVASRCLPRDQQPEDLNGAIGFLLSAESDFMTGQVMVVDGGSVMN